MIRRLAGRYLLGLHLDLNSGDSIWYGKFKNKPGKIKSFKEDAKSGDPIVVVEPDPKGRKDDKEIKLLKIRERQAAMQNSFDHYYEKFEDAWRRLLLGKNRVEALVVQHQHPWPETLAVKFLRGEFSVFLNAGNLLARSIMDTKSLTAVQGKDFELASRLFVSSVRVPNKPLTWIEKNRKYVELLLLSDTWPEKAQEGPEKFRVGLFNVHNTIGAVAADLDRVVGNIKKAEAAALPGKLPKGFDRVLYGDVYIVARIEKARTWALYFPSDDNIYVRSEADGKLSEEQTLLHELAHRYWRKFADAGRKSYWTLHHQHLAKGAVKGKEAPKIPDVGDKLPIKVQGTPRGWYPVVLRIEGGHYFYEAPVRGVTRLFSTPMQRVVEFYRAQEEQKAIRGKFPTPYAATNEEEHFCEATSLYLLGRLDKANTEAYEEIWG
jgi:ribosomal protein L32E